MMPELEVLHLHGVQFSPDAEHSTQGAPGTPLLSLPIPKLRLLTLLGYHLPLDGLHLQTKVERVQVVHERPSSFPDQQDDSFNAALNTALPQLPNLRTLLVFSDHLRDDAALIHVSTLSKLQALKIGGDKLSTASLLSLPAGLTALQLVTCRNMSINARTAPAILQLTRLQELHVSLGESVVLCPAVLAPLTNLSVLRPHKCVLSSTAQLSVLSGLTKLQHLQLSGALGSDQVAGLSAAACSTLTASSHLTVLGLGGWLLSPEQCRAMFPAGRLLPRLVELTVGPGFFYDAQAAAQLASSCPAVTELAFEGHADPPAPAAADDAGLLHSSAACDSLAQLQAVEVLDLSSVALTNSMQLRALARMQQLTDLQLGGVLVSVLDGMLQLTACTRLQKLRYTMFEEEEVEGENTPLVCRYSLITLPPSLIGLSLSSAFELSTLGFQGPENALQNAVTGTVTSVSRSLPGYVIAGFIRMYQHMITYKRLQGEPLSSARVQETCALALAAVRGRREAYEQKLLSAQQKPQAVESLFTKAATALSSDECWKFWQCAAGYAASSSSSTGLELQIDTGSAAAGSFKLGSAQQAATSTPGVSGSHSSSIQAADSAASEAQELPNKWPTTATGAQEPEPPAEQDTAPQVDQGAPPCSPCSSSGSDPGTGAGSSLAWLGLLAALSSLQQHWLQLTAEVVTVKRELAAYEYSFKALQADIERLNKLQRSWERMVAGQEAESDQADLEGPGGVPGDEGSSGAADAGADGQDEGSRQGDD